MGGERRRSLRSWSYSSANPQCAMCESRTCYRAHSVTSQFIGSFFEKYVVKKLHVYLNFYLFAVRVSSFTHSLISGQNEGGKNVFLEVNIWCRFTASDEIFLEMVAKISYLEFNPEDHPT